MSQVKSTDGYELLLKNIQKGLKVYSPEELNGAIISLLRQKPDKSREKNFIINKVCEQYKLTRRALIFSKNRGEFSQARQLTICLLHYELGLSLRHIALVVFEQKSHFRIGEATRYYKTLNPDIKSDKEFQKKYTHIQMKLISYMNENNKDA